MGPIRAQSNANILICPWSTHVDLHYSIQALPKPLILLFSTATVSTETTPSSRRIEP